MPQRADVWKPPNKHESEPVHLEQFERWLKGRFFLYKPDIIVVEKLRVFRNRTTVAALLKREGVALLVAKKHRAIVVNEAVGRSRNIVLGIPANSNKELAFQYFKKQYIDFKLLASNQGGMDEADAMVGALAGPDLLERR